MICVEDDAYFVEKINIYISRALLLIQLSITAENDVKKYPVSWFLFISIQCT